MDPTNNPIPNPTPTPNPNPVPEPGPDVAANPPIDPVAPAASPADPVAPPASPAPVAPEGPAAPPVGTPATAAGGMTTPPVNPIINPTGAATAAGNVAHASGLSATDPIMMPEPAPAPDPVEEELKAPMKAAEPAPGSIGSAVSGPAAEIAPDDAMAPGNNPFENKQTPSVAFNDPATQPDPGAPNGSIATDAPQKKTNKTTLVALIIVAVMIVIALAGVLIFQLMGEQGGSPVGGGAPNTSVTIEEEDGEEEETTSASVVVAGEGALSCTRNMTTAEVAKINDAVSGTINISVEFDDDNMLSKIALTEMVTYSDEDSVSNEPVENKVHEALAENLTPESANIYFLPTDGTGALDLTKKSVQANYESLDFTCEVL